MIHILVDAFVLMNKRMADLFLKRNDDIEELIYKQDTRLNIG